MESNLTPQPAEKNDHFKSLALSATLSLLIFFTLAVMNLKCNSSVDEWRQFPLLCQPKVAEIREMIMKGREEES